MRALLPVAPPSQHSIAAALSSAADLRSTGVLVAFDPDQAGRRAAVRAYHVLSQFTVPAMPAVLPPGQDPARILSDHGPQGLAAILGSQTHPLADLVIDEELEKWSRWLQYADGRFNALRAAAPIVAALAPTDVARQVARLSDRLGLDHATVTDAVTSAIPEVVRGTPRSSHVRSLGTRPSTRAVGIARPHSWIRGISARR